MPFGAELGLLLFQVGNLLGQLLQLLGIVFTLDGLALDFELFDTPRDFIEGLGHRVDLDTQFGGSLIHQVDGLIGQEPVGDVPLRQLYGSDDGIIFNPHLVVVFIPFLQTTQNRYTAHLVGLVDHNDLEPTLQSLILLEVFLILVEGSGTDGPQFATGQGRFQDVGGIHGTVALAGTYQGVNLIDEEDDFALALDYLVDYRFESFLKLTFVFGTGDKGTHVEREDLFALQVFGHIATHDTVSQPLGDSRFTGTRFTYQDRVVFGTPAQDLQHPTYLVVTPDNRVEFAAAGTLGQVDGIFAQRIIGILGRSFGYFLPFPQLIDSSSQLLLGNAGILQERRSRTFGQEQTHQHGFQSHKLVAQFLRVVDGFLKSVVSLAAQVGFAPAYLWQRFYLTIELAVQQTGVDTQLLEEVRSKAFAHLQDSFQQVHRLDRLLVVVAGNLHGLLHGLLRFDCKIVKVHMMFSFLISWLCLRPCIVKRSAKPKRMKYCLKISRLI